MGSSQDLASSPHSKAGCEARCHSQRSCPAAQTRRLQPERKDPAHRFVKEKCCLTQPAQEATLAESSEQPSATDCGDRCRLLSPCNGLYRPEPAGGIFGCPPMRATCSRLSGHGAARSGTGCPALVPVGLLSCLGTGCTHRLAQRASLSTPGCLTSAQGCARVDGFVTLLRKTTYFPLPLLLPFHPIPLC